MSLCSAREDTISRNALFDMIPGDIDIQKKKMLPEISLFGIGSDIEMYKSSKVCTYLFNIMLPESIKEARRAASDHWVAFV